MESGAMTEIRLTPEAAKAVVTGGTTLRTKSIQKVTRIADSPVEGKSASMPEVFHVKNVGNRSLLPGEPIVVSGFENYTSTATPTAEELEQARQKMIKNEFVLNVNRATSGFACLTPIDTIEQGEVGAARAIVPLFYGVLYRSPGISVSETGTTAFSEDTDFYAQGSSEDYRIVAEPTGYVKGRCVALLAFEPVTSVPYTSKSVITSVTNGSGVLSQTSGTAATQLCSNAVVSNGLLYLEFFTVSNAVFGSESVKVLQ